MWRRLSTQIRPLAVSRSTPRPNRCIVSSSTLPCRPTVSVFSRYFSTPPGDGVSTKKVEDVYPYATGNAREELEAELQGRNLLDINFPEGPFGTEEAPAVVKSVYDKRIVGCPGDEGEDEHDVVWFWLEKGKPHVCPVCSQYFMLEVVGPGGPPPGHEDDDDH